MRALLLIDLQNDFLPGGSLAVGQGNQVIPIANRLIDCFDFVVATQDWHPQNHESFASNHPGHQIGQVIDLNGQEQVLWPDHCVQGTSGAELSGDLASSRIDQVVRKGEDPCIDSYSGFYDNGHLRETQLDSVLRSREASELYVMGLATDYCVKFTVLDARKLNWTTHVILPGCRAVNLSPHDGQNAIDEMRAAGAVIHESLDSALA